MTATISVVNQKGGVGKTTTAVNLASCLAAGNYETLLVDVDPQGNATSGIGISPADLEYSLYDALSGQREGKECIIETVFEHLSIIPSNIDLSGADIALLDQQDRFGKLKSIIESLKDYFDFVILDSPPSLSLLALNVLAAADSAVIPVQCEYYALEGLTTLMQTFERVKEEINPDLEVLGVLMTMFDRRTNLSQQVVEEVKKVFKENVFESVIPRSVKLSEAPSFGQPIILYDFNSAGSKAYIQLSQEVIERVKENSVGQRVGRVDEDTTEERVGGSAADS